MFLGSILKNFGESKVYTLDTSRLFDHAWPAKDPHPGILTRLACSLCKMNIICSRKGPKGALPKLPRIPLATEQRAHNGARARLRMIRFFWWVPLLGNPPTSGLSRTTLGGQPIEWTTGINHFAFSVSRSFGLHAALWIPRDLQRVVNKYKMSTQEETTQRACNVQS